jgi:hypothetical protein
LRNLQRAAPLAQTSELLRGADRSKGKETIVKTLLLFCLFVLMTVSCAPARGEGQAVSETPNAVMSPEISETMPVSFAGAVQIAGGSCCLGGYAGETIQSQVSFSEASPFGRVSSMRVKPGCSADTDLESAEWESFTDSKSYPIYVALNWTGFTVCAQYQDEHGNLSPVYRDDISVEGMPRPPLVSATDWYDQIRCFSEQEVHPGPNEVVTGTSITFRWPDTNDLPEGVSYKVFAYGASDGFAGVAASGQTVESSITLQIDPARAGEIGWYVVLVDANGTMLDHGQCSTFPASLLTVDPPVGLKAVFFQFQP